MKFRNPFQVTHRGSEKKTFPGRTTRTTKVARLPEMKRIQKGSLKNKGSKSVGKDAKQKPNNFVFNQQLGCGFKYFLFSPLFGEDSHFD